MGLILSVLSACVLLVIALSAENYKLLDAARPDYLARDARFASSLALSGIGTASAAVFIALGFWRYFAPLRYLAIGLFGLTVLKVFLVDLLELGGIYRILGFMGIGVVLLVVSFLYQRTRKKTPEAGAPTKEAGPSPIPAYSLDPPDLIDLLDLTHPLIPLPIGRLGGSRDDPAGGVKARPTRALLQSDDLYAGGLIERERDASARARLPRRVAMEAQRVRIDVEAMAVGKLHAMSDRDRQRLRDRRRTVGAQRARHSSGDQRAVAAVGAIGKCFCRRHQPGLRHRRG